VTLSTQLLVALPMGGGAVYALWRLRAGRTWAIATPVASVLAHFGLQAAGLSAPQAAACALFVFVYALIASERIHRTKLALVGASLMLLLRLVDQHAALHGHGEVAGTDWNTILLLIGMMIVVEETRRTGVFEWTAIKAARLARGEPVLIIIYMCTATALLSTVLDNVTTVLLFAPVTLLVCQSLKVDPAPYLISVIIASNIGGTATLVGDPPNIMIGSAGHISFMEFLAVDGPITALVMAAFLVTVWLAFRKRLVVTPEQRAHVMAFDESKAITDPAMLKRCGAVIGAILAGFCVHGAVGLEPATIALAGAAIILLISKGTLEEAFRAVEWETIFFYLGLFIMVSGLVEVGVVKLLADSVLAAAGADAGLSKAGLAALTMGVLWLSALAAGVMGNVAFVPIMSAIIADLAVGVHGGPADAAVLSHQEAIYPLWWALSLGACFGGNFTLVGAGANVVVAGIADRSNHPIGFMRYMKYGVPLTLQSLLLSSVYLWLRFLR
jgi:Na+/H+ antiporter NhaD/arsenite permease-like protein